MGAACMGLTASGRGRSLANLNYGEDKTCEATNSGAPDVFTLVGTWPPPALPRPIQRQGFSPAHSIPHSGGPRGRPRTSAVPGGGRGHAEGE